jgi:hypothetical protein
MPKRLLRLSLVYGPNGRLPIGRTQFYRNYVVHDDDGGDEFIPGTSVRRLRLIPLGARAVAIDEGEVDRVIGELAADRAAGRPHRIPPHHALHEHGHRPTVARYEGPGGPGGPGSLNQSFLGGNK